MPIYNSSKKVKTLEYKFTKHKVPKYGIYNFRITPKMCKPELVSGPTNPGPENPIIAVINYEIYFKDILKTPEDTLTKYIEFEEKAVLFKRLREFDSEQLFLFIPIDFNDPEKGGEFEFIRVLANPLLKKLSETKVNNIYIGENYLNEESNLFGYILNCKYKSVMINGVNLKLKEAFGKTNNNGVVFGTITPLRLEFEPEFKSAGYKIGENDNEFIDGFNTSEFYFHLNLLGFYLKIYTNFKVFIVGHTDRKGDESKNKLLSQNRALAFKTFLLQDKFSIVESVFTVNGMGESKMKADGFTDGKEDPAYRTVEVILKN